MSAGIAIALFGFQVTLVAAVFMIRSAILDAAESVAAAIRSILDHPPPAQPHAAEAPVPPTHLHAVGGEP